MDTKVQAIPVSGHSGHKEYRLYPETDAKGQAIPGSGHKGTGYTRKWTQSVPAISGGGHKGKKLYLQLETKGTGYSRKRTEKGQAIL